LRIRCRRRSRRFAVERESQRRGRRTQARGLLEVSRRKADRLDLGCSMQKRAKDGCSRRSRLRRALKAGDLGLSHSTSARRLASRGRRLAGTQIGRARAREQGLHGSRPTGQRGRNDSARGRRAGRQTQAQRTKGNNPAGRLRKGPAAGAHSGRSQPLEGRSRASRRLAAVIAISREPAALSRNQQADPLASDPKAEVSGISQRVGAGLARSRHGRSQENVHREVLAARPEAATVRRSSEQLLHGYRLRARMLNR